MVSFLSEAFHVYHLAGSYCVPTVCQGLSSLLSGKRIRLPMQEMWGPSLDWEDPLEKGMATHSSIPAWEIPWTDEPGWLVYGVAKRRGMTDHTCMHQGTGCK